MEPVKASISPSATPVSWTTNVAAPAASYPARSSARRSSTWPAKNATARIAGAIAKAAKPGRGQAWPRSTRASHRSPRLTAPLPQFARDVFAQFFQHNRDGRFDVLGGRTVFQLLAEGVEQKLLFARLACRDRRSNFIPVGPGFFVLALSFGRIARSVSGVNRAQRSRHLTEVIARFCLHQRFLDREVRGLLHASEAPRARAVGRSSAELRALLSKNTKPN